MGKSYTYHCIGIGVPDKEGSSRAFFAMNRLEILQARAQAKREGVQLDHWYWQTKVGCRILGIDEYTSFIMDKDLIFKVAGTIQCPICKGQITSSGGVSTYCSVCFNSGITTKARVSGYRDWQLENMKKRFDK